MLQEEVAGDEAGGDELLRGMEIDVEREVPEINLHVLSPSFCSAEQIDLWSFC